VAGITYAIQGEETHKVVFLAVFQGDQLHAKVRKICDGLAFSCCLFCQNTHSRS